MAYLLIVGCLALSALVLCQRNRKLRKLSEDLDRLLHNGTPLPIREYQEGELSILANQLQKVTLRLQESAEQSHADKVRLSESLADISHQLRTPLTAMNLTAALLSAPDLTDERRMELTVELRDLLNRTDWLVESLLKLSKLDAGTVVMSRETVPVQELIARACGPLAVPMELLDQRLVIQCGDEAFIGDPVWTAEALGNIVKNCMEHTPAGGTISITGSETALYTGITVEDTGSGFDEKDIPHLFDRFYKGANASESSYGIGLALARTIVTAQNGTIRALNGEKGARFEIKFYKSII